MQQDTPFSAPLPTSEITGKEQIIISQQPPQLSEQDAIRVAADHYALTVTARLFPGEYDRNFHLHAQDGREFVLKIAHAGEDQLVLDLQNSALAYLAEHAPGLKLPVVVPTTAGEGLATIQANDSTYHYVRLLTYLPGKVLARVKPHTPELLYDLGHFLGKLNHTLREFSHPAMQRTLKWDLARADWISNYFIHIADPQRRARVERLFVLYETQVKPRRERLRSSVIHNDANDYNVLHTTSRQTALLDFGDMLHTWTISELAIACAYVMLDKPDPLAAAAHVVAGYHAANPLSEAELAVLYPLICARLCVSVTNAAWQRLAQPDNGYLLISEQPVWTLLERLEVVPPALAHYIFRHACDLPPCPQALLVEQWLNEHADQFGKLIDPDPRSANNVVFDLSIGSYELGSPLEWSNTAVLTRKLFERMQEADAQVGIGLYDEARPFYAGEQFRTESNNGPEWRTVHIGLDLYVEAGAPVYAPLDGTIYSVANNRDPFDYGPTLILKHTINDGTLTFFTLYGHLSEDSLEVWSAGMSVERGRQIARIGNYPINGNWPPHLHFQIINDMLGNKDNFPGVARPSEREIWLTISPDPNLIAGISAERLPHVHLKSSEHVLEQRERVVGKALSISYSTPLHIVRGWRQHLYDEDGRAYLDVVNNVCHVGHCHPHVVKAGQRQMAILNTNTRYLHGLLGHYAERLCATLPAPLRVCYFVCSGSEANELALRLAQTHTRRKNIVVVDVAYHGNTTTLIDISPYKHDGPGGEGRPAYVHKVPMPDTYRGLYRRDDAQAGAHYAQHIQSVIEQHPDRIAAFICESLLSCGGQIVLPPGYLKEAYRYVREAGGVCIADEVQVGFGRCGSHFWGFELQDVVPDIVTMGKPIGNGHPLAAVVTTPEIAASFDNGMEYFNTFGGNPVSCAIGSAVLDVIEDEHLQENARNVGAYLQERLRALQERHALIGDVRGSGLFIGVELVKDRQTLVPATEQATYIINRLRDNGILLSTDGPLHNVLKIKPPLIFSRADADILVAALDKILAEDGAQPISV